MSNAGQTMVGLADVSIASLSGSSQLLMAENTGRQSMLIQNIGNANVGIKFAPLGQGSTNPTAAIAAAGTFTLVPGDSYEPDGGFVPGNAVWVIGTAGQPITAMQS